MAVRLMVASQKGGVGKTTVALNLALAMAERGWSTLLVDLDPQGGVGHALARGDASLPGVADLLMHAVTPEQAVLHTKEPHLALLPRGRLSPVDVPEFERALHGKGVLEGLLHKVEPGFRLVIMDTPAGLGMVTRGAMTVADWVLVPFQAETLAVRSMSQLLQLVEHARLHDNPRLQFLGAVPTMVEKAAVTSQNLLLEIWRTFPDILETVIPRAEVFALASAKGLPISYLGGPRAPEAARFGALAQEVENALARRIPAEVPHGQDDDRQLF